MMRPVLARLCRYESLVDGTLDLADIALLNDTLSVKQDNDAILSEWLKKRNG